ncbi:hypothetical protein CY34DRAFT_18140 [Suillus luteus UH-Slu-Lm8-n1]|uniref:Uncharacterized protein n=1 Tax=Suillus luteus UH-Slu-Lm8-n1 TaxID=930992 RepID=A0A0C9Z8I0_9AGAM|nr:hypothetical protein CY34DRAFT_18140 [Suillus luteus UH-Slu-Lm8-n1]
MDVVIKQISKFIGKLIGATREVSIDWFIHRVIQGKNAKNNSMRRTMSKSSSLRSLASNLRSYLSTILFLPRHRPRPWRKHLDYDVDKLLKMAREFADVKSQTISVEKLWHEAVVGQGGTTLNAIIGEDTTLSIKFGGEVGNGSDEDVILVRDASLDVDRAVRDISKVVEDAKNDAIVSSYSIEFDIDREYHRRSLRPSINRTGVQVQFPGSRSYNQFGDPENASEMADTDPANIVKVSGSRKACEAAVEELKTYVKPAAPESVTAIVSLKYHHAISQQGYFFRTLRTFGVSVEQSGKPQKPAVPVVPPQNGSTTARIDDAENAPSIEVHWRVAENHCPLISKLIYFRPIVPVVMRNFSSYWTRKLVNLVTMPWIPTERMKDQESFRGKKAASETPTTLSPTAMQSEVDGLNPGRMDIMLKANSASSSSEQLTDAELLGQMNVMVFAGLDTTTFALIGWVDSTLLRYIYH